MKILDVFAPLLPLFPYSPPAPPSLRVQGNSVPVLSNKCNKSRESGRTTPTDSRRSSKPPNRRDRQMESNGALATTDKALSSDVSDNGSVFKIIDLWNNTLKLRRYWTPRGMHAKGPLYLTHVIGYGVLGYVIKGILDGKDVVVKWVEEETGQAELEWESKVYKDLRSQWGHAIPHCFGLFGSADRTHSVLVLSYEGRPIQDIRERAQDVLTLVKKIHDLGIVHGDVAARNILARKDASLCLIDFHCSYHHGEPCDGHCTELEELDSDVQKSAAVTSPEEHSKYDLELLPH
ncbi:hypothetical protein DACRYDRAFT_19595 [Dacryopinax primogenitus]|uniref:Protein kinase domain-containing protein n=1 Tax=Dacryopinax primogenitus (strain DJM 731) TaxID=1858805 RepID=M5GH12_DACPD|nr:uncharacterized protein DACRYDRAFT_19595 [Dacryopinax primogenitus]EJU06433.1 hypothetical protein DACRYDRAFT_19595 [Dacryopinax primogenitus]